MRVGLTFEWYFISIWTLARKFCPQGKLHANKILTLNMDEKCLNGKGFKRTHRGLLFSPNKCSFNWNDDVSHQGTCYNELFCRNKLRNLATHLSTPEHSSMPHTPSFGTSSSISSWERLSHPFLKNPERDRITFKFTERQRERDRDIVGKIEGELTRISPRFVLC